jgi:hypothetical protein
VRLGSRNGIVTKLKGIVDGWVMRHRVVGHGFDGPEVTSANRLMAEFLMLAVYGAGEARGHVSSSKEFHYDTVSAVL